MLRFVYAGRLLRRAELVGVRPPPSEADDRTVVSSRRKCERRRRRGVRDRHITALSFHGFDNRFRREFGKKERSKMCRARIATQHTLAGRFRDVTALVTAPHMRPFTIEGNLKCMFKASRFKCDAI